MLLEDANRDLDSLRLRAEAEHKRKVSVYDAEWEKLRGRINEAGEENDMLKKRAIEAEK